jgi:hypothetical protein
VRVNAISFQPWQASAFLLGSAFGVLQIGWRLSAA